MVSSIRRGPAIESIRDIVAWVRQRPWYYAYAVLFLWGIVPGLRRVVDWKTSFSSVSVVSILPLLALLPAAAALFLGGRLARIGRAPLAAAWLWFGAFAYAYAIGIVAGNAVSGTYTFLGFILPMCFGLYVASLDVPMLVLYERLATFALALAVPVALYAFFQYALPPAWDLLWIQQTGFVNVGIAAPFSFRPFSTLNGPGPFADFLICVLILNLPRLRGANAFRALAIAIVVGALALSQVRADWLAFAIAMVTFVALGPHKLRNLSSIAVFGIVLSIGASNASSLFGNTQSGIDLEKRFDSLTSISTDSSYLDREGFSANALAAAVGEPLGAGLGVVGVAAKLGTSGSTVDFDNGYLARFTEMGYAGVAGYGGTLALILALTLRRWWVFTRGGKPAHASIAAAVVAMEVALTLLDISGDHHANFTGIFCWLSFALIFMGDAPGVEAQAAPAR